jgi:hypothetical protein
MDPKDILRNPKDPLHGAMEDREVQVLRDIGKALHGVPLEACANVGMNLTITAVRQAFSTWSEAEKHMKNLQGRQMQVLKDHYDSVSGRKKGVFPYDQVIAVPPIKIN